MRHRILVPLLALALTAGVAAPAWSAVPGPVVPGVTSAWGSAASPDGASMAFAISNTLHLFDVEDQTYSPAINIGTNLVNVAYSADGATLYLVDATEERLFVLDATTGAQRPGSPVTVVDAASGLAARAGVVYVSSANTAGFSIVDTTVVPFAVVNTASPLPNLQDLVLSPDGSRLYAASGSSLIGVLDTATGAALPSLPSLGPASTIAISPDGSTLFAGSGEGSVYIVDPSGIEPPAEVEYESTRTGLSFDLTVSPDGQYVYVVSWIVPLLAIIEVDSQTTIQTLALPQYPFSIDLSPDGLTGYVMISNTGLQLFDLALPVVRRIAGVDRIATAVEISKDGFDPGVPVVYVATAMNFPDALSAGAAAAHLGGPLLLVPTSGVPGIVTAELERLEPELIVVVGGESVVPPATFTALGELTTDIRRDAGGDRYETSLIVTANAFTTDAKTAYIATGANFPDALSASAAAAHRDAPVILVPGAATILPKPITDLLAELVTETAIVVGGPTTVTPALQADLEALPGVTARRIAGVDRYATSVAINRDAFTTSDTVFLATGTGFADALAGGALAAVYDAALYVTPPTCVDAGVLTDIDDLPAFTAVLLGGTGTLSSNVEALVGC